LRASDATARAREDALVEDALRHGGEIAMRAFKSGQKGWSKHDGTPVSDTDLAVNELLHARLTSAFPDYGWLSEETADTQDRLARERVWVVDPIDGTSAFLAGSDGWCIAVALIEHGRPVLAGVFQPVTQEHFAARLHAGATLNGREIHVSDRRALEGASLLVKPRVLSLDLWPRPWPPVRTAMTPSIALRLCRIARGAEDATFGIGPKSDWDLAAGDLIVHEAGGRMGDLAGRRMVYNRPQVRQDGFVASGPDLFEDLVERTAPATGHRTGGDHGRARQGT